MDLNEKRDLDPSSDEELIKLAKQRFQVAVEAETENRRQELEDQQFLTGEQWPMEIRNQRMLDMRPCLTVNRLPQFIRQVTNDQRQNRPSIKVNPCDSKATVDTAKILQGMIRHIEYNSHADIAYDTAFEYAASSGIGYFRIVTDYSDPMSFQQEILIKRIKDRFSVYLDPFYQEPDGSDCQWGFIFDDMSRDEFQVQFPDAKLSGMSDWSSLGDNQGMFINAEAVRVAEYYYKVWEEVELCLLSDKRCVEKKDLPDKLPDGLRVISERKSLVPKIKWAKINGIEVLDKTEIHGQWIPIIPVIGEEFIVEGRRILSGIVRNAKDPQRMYNYYASAATEMIALAPKAPFIGAEGQFEGYEDIWKSANFKNHSFLQYKPKTIGGIAVPPPARTQFEPQVQSITVERQQASDELKAVTGIYDASLGNRSNEQSGIAIQRRNSQSQISNFHFIDNLSRSLRHAGRILINWIPEIYSSAQAVRIIGEDGEVKMQEINQLIPGPGGDKKTHFLDAGTYDCTVDTGPSFQTKRQEAVGSMLDLTKAAPQLMQMAGDILVRNMDWPGSSEIADRIKRSLPPQITSDDEGDPIPPQAKQQMTQMSTMIQKLSQELDASTKVIENKSLELMSKERIAAMEQKTQLAIELMKHDQKDAATIFQAEQDHIDRQLDIDRQQQESLLNNSGAGGNAAPPTNQQPVGAGPQAAPQGAMQ
jgi:hypothetical protein